MWNVSESGDDSIFTVYYIHSRMREKGSTAYLFLKSFNFATSITAGWRIYHFVQTAS